MLVTHFCMTRHKYGLKMPPNTVIFSIVRQSSSWGRFKATKDIFHQLLNGLNVFPFFVDTVVSFGFKLKDDEKFGCWNVRLGGSPGEQDGCIGE